SGWTHLDLLINGAFSSRVAYRVATGAGTSSGTWSNAQLLIVTIFRGTREINPLGNWEKATGTSNTVTYPALDLQNSDGTSFVIGFGGHLSTNTNMPAPTGMTNYQRANTGNNRAAA